MKTIKSAVIAILLVVTVASNAMAVTSYATIRDRVREYLYENYGTAYSSYTDTMLNECIDHAQRFVADALPQSSNIGLLKVVPIAVSTTTSSVDLPSDFRRIIAVKYASLAAQQVKLEDYFSKPIRANINKDVFFTMLNDEMTLFPAPTNATQSVEILYEADITLGGPNISIKDTLKPELILATVQQVLYVDGQVERAGSIATLLGIHLKAVRDRVGNSNVVEKLVTNEAK